MFKFYTIKNAALFLCVILAPQLSDAQKIDYRGLPQWSEHQEGITNYWLYTPENLEKGKVYPVAIFLHGCCPEDEVLRPRSLVDPPVRMWHNFAENTQSIPTYIIVPVSKRGWSQHIDDIKKVSDELIADGQGDRQRIYITGFSMGGGGTWEFLNRYPDYFAAALPMGSGLRGNIKKMKDIPIWTNIGENDPRAQVLKDSVAVFRAVNGDSRGALEWVTGVNPRFTEHDGIGHGVQWNAVSTQDLLSWAYEKKNDGNPYPVIFFKKPQNLETFKGDQIIPFELAATDSDAKIRNVKVFLNGEFKYDLDQPPYTGTVRIKDGDNNLSATAFDEKGKSSTADIIIKTDIQPTFITRKLPVAQQGQLYTFQLDVRGNQELSFQLAQASDPFPDGLSLSQSGELNGIPEVNGRFKICISATDAENDRVEKEFVLAVKAKNKNDVIVSHVIACSGNPYVVSKFAKSVLPFTGKNSETNISDPSVFEGLTFIQTYHGDRDSSDVDFLSFEVDEDVIVYIAYEKCDHLYSSTVPDWLKDFKKEESGQIVAQYFYFDVYSKSFPEGKITIPGANASEHQVNNNYMVLVSKK